jgi:hypothetical protein
MSKILNEITIINGKYKDQNGQEKNKYQKIGLIIDTKNGPMLKLDSIPICEPPWNGWAYINTPKPKQAFKEDFKDDDIGF